MVWSKLSTVERSVRHFKGNGKYKALYFATEGKGRVNVNQSL